MVEKVKMPCKQAWVPERDFWVLSVLHNLFLFSDKILFCGPSWP